MHVDGWAEGVKPNYPDNQHRLRWYVYVFSHYDRTKFDDVVRWTVCIAVLKIIPFRATSTAQLRLFFTNPTPRPRGSALRVPWQGLFLYEPIVNGL
jgi:hypothetical protein